MFFYFIIYLGQKFCFEKVLLQYLKCVLNENNKWKPFLICFDEIHRLWMQIEMRMKKLRYDHCLYIDEHL